MAYLVKSSRIGYSSGLISLWNRFINFQRISLLSALLEPTKFNSIEKGITIFSLGGLPLCTCQTGLSNWSFFSWEENFSINSLGYKFDFFDSKTILKLELINHSVAPLKIRYVGKYNFHTEFNFFEIKANSKIEVYLKTLDVLEKVDLPFEILNYVIAPKNNLKITKKISIKWKKYLLFLSYYSHLI